MKRHERLNVLKNSVLFGNRASYIDYIHSNDWQLKRAAIINPTAKCEICGYNKRLQLHHKHYKTLFNETPNDFIVLCYQCHKKIHGKKVVNSKIKRKKNKSLKPKELDGFGGIKKRYDFNCRKRYSKSYSYY